MQTLRQLKQKYSGQAVPEWELVANGLKDGPTTEEAPKRRGRPPKAEVIEAEEPEGE